MVNWINKKRNKRGFTLIELVVVIAILGILAAIAIPRFSNVTDNAKSKANLAEHRILVSAVEMFRASSPTMALPTAMTDFNAYLEGGVTKINGGTAPTGNVITNANGTHTITFTTDKTTIVSVSSASTAITTTTGIDK